MSKDIVRVMRVLVYEGSRQWVESILKKSNVPLEGCKEVQGVVIKSALIDKFPEIIKESEGVK